MSSSPDPAAQSDELDIDRALADVERSLNDLKTRHAQVLMDQNRQQDLQQRISDTQKELRRHRTKQAAGELKQLQQQLDEVELALESRLFSWSGLKEPFWMAVRFGGLGILIGWLLNSLAGS